MDRVFDTPRPRRVVLGSLIGRITLVLIVFTVAVYIGIYLRTEALVIEAVEEQARTYTQLIVNTRAWNSRYGGVFVERLPGVESNPYLEQLGVDPDIDCTDGRTLTLRNPALMTNEIADILALETGVVFHLTSLDPVNPENAADDWEEHHLIEFERSDVREAGEIVESGEHTPVYRYMVPLIVDSSCLACHADQGYQPGEIRGGISVTIPISAIKRDLRLNAFGLAALGTVTLVGILAIVYVMSARVVDRLEDAEEQLERLAVTDALTDLWNRRYMMRELKAEFDRSRRQGHDLGLIVLDLDNFKSVNDRFGHGFGDLVLQAAARRMGSAMREYDTLGRFGGEEFLVIVPETGAQDVVKLAERIRTQVSREPVAGSGEEITVTVSGGVAMLADGDLTPDALLARADGALYAAKGLGRDRVVLGESPESRGIL